MGEQERPASGKASVRLSSFPAPHYWGGGASKLPKLGADGLPLNPALHQFVQREQQYHRNSAGRIVREPNVYVIKMDDPLHELDQLSLDAELAKRADKSRTTQSEPYGQPRIAQNEPAAVQIELPMAQNDPRTAQIEPYDKVSITPTTQEIPQTSAALPGVLPAAVSGEAPKDMNESESAFCPFDLLPDAAREPWLAAAEQALREKFGLAAWLKTREKTRAAFRAQRAGQLYRQANGERGP